MAAFPYTITPKKTTAEFPPGTVAGDWWIRVGLNGSLVAEARNPEGNLSVLLQPGTYTIVVARLDGAGKLLGDEVSTAFTVDQAVVIEVADGAIVSPV